MWLLAERQNYELAAKYRDLHRTVLALGEQQKMALTADRDVDIFGFYREKQLLALQLFTMREGRIVGRREFFWEDLDAENFDVSEFLGEVLAQYYSTDYVPLEIHVPADFADREILEKVLTERRGRKVRILDPKRGQKAEMITLVENNAKVAFEQRFRVLKTRYRKSSRRLAGNSRTAASARQNRKFRHLEHLRLGKTSPASSSMKTANPPAPNIAASSSKPSKARTITPR